MRIVINMGTRRKAARESAEISRIERDIRENRERVRLLRPNAAMMDKIALCTLGHLESGDPPALASLMGDLAARYPHVDIWGGCCGTWEVHLDEIAARVVSSRAATA